MAAEVAFAGADWVALLAEAYGDLPARPAPTAVVEHTATGGPDGEVSWWTAFVDGRLVDAGAGHHPDPTVTMTSPVHAGRPAGDRSGRPVGRLHAGPHQGGAATRPRCCACSPLMATPRAYRTATAVVAGRTRA